VSRAEMISEDNLYQRNEQKLNKRLRCDRPVNAFILCLIGGLLKIVSNCNEGYITPSHVSGLGYPNTIEVAESSLKIEYLLKIHRA